MIIGNNGSPLSLVPYSEHDKIPELLQVHLGMSYDILTMEPVRCRIGYIEFAPFYFLYFVVQIMKPLAE